MKKFALAIAAAIVALSAVAPAQADEYHHHHPVCHKVKVHGHWEKRCH
jgi:invasion protein IalB